jgi:rare lipoprotein A
MRPLLLVAAALLMVSCAGTPRAEKTGYAGEAVASWYGPGFHGKLTASGEKYNMHAMTCAHKTLPFGTKLKLVSRENGESAVVVVNDRGPFVRGRDIDLSRAAAEKLGIIGPGTGRVRVYLIGRDMRYARYLKGGSPERPEFAGPYTIQVGSFRKRENARRLRDGLDLNHKKVYVLIKWVEGRKYFRVRVGRFEDGSSASQYATLLAGEGYTASIIPYERPF